MRTSLVIVALAALGLAGCNSAQKIDPRLAAGVFCVLSNDGAVIAVATTKGGAQATAQKVAASQPVLCDAATQVGAVLAK